MRTERILAFAAAAAIAACAATGPQPDANGVLAFTGTVSASDNSCHFDAVCTATVGGTMVTTMSGERLNNPIWGQPNNQPAVGDRVEVRCLRTGANSCTLKGDTGYYIRPVK